jgi:hypothetical protein
MLKLGVFLSCLARVLKVEYYVIGRQPNVLYRTWTWIARDASFICKFSKGS